MNTIAYNILKVSSDREDVMALAERAGGEYLGDWDGETSWFLFEDNSVLRISGNVAEERSLQEYKHADLGPPPRYTVDPAMVRGRSEFVQQFARKLYWVKKDDTQ